MRVINPDQRARMFAQTLRVLCGEEPPEDLVRKWIAGDESHVETGDDTLQDWASVNRPFYWMTGIGLLDAAEALIDEVDPNEELP